MNRSEFLKISPEQKEVETPSLIEGIAQAEVSLLDKLASQGRDFLPLLGALMMTSAIAFTPEDAHAQGRSGPDPTEEMYRVATRNPVETQRETLDSYEDQLREVKREIRVIETRYQEEIDALSLTQGEIDQRIIELEEKKDETRNALIKHECGIEIRKLKALKETLPSDRAGAERDIERLEQERAIELEPLLEEERYLKREVRSSKKQLEASERVEDAVRTGVELYRRHRPSRRSQSR